MQQTSIHNEDILRCILALNNLGITQLNRRCFKQAQDTLKDAVRIAQGFGGSLHLELAAALHRAHERSLHPKPSVEIDLPIEVLSDDGVSYIFGSAMQHFDHGLNGIHLIRIEKNDFERASDLNMNFLSAVVVYNCALSYLCQARSEKDRDRIQKLSSVSLAALTLASNACPSLYENLTLSTLCLAMFILRATILVLKALGLESEVCLHVKRLGHLRAVTEQLEAKVHAVCPAEAAAPAA